MTPEEITARCDEFTPDSLKALSLWMTRNNEKEHGKPLVREEKILPGDPLPVETSSFSLGDVQESKNADGA